MAAWGQPFGTMSRLATRDRRAFGSIYCTSRRLAQSCRHAHCNWLVAAVDRLGCNAQLARHN
eukprot:9835417-Lingulodinium_polyedra.AAC.1